MNKIWIICLLGFGLWMVGCVHDPKSVNQGLSMFREAATTDHAEVGSKVKQIFSVQTINNDESQKQIPIQGYPGEIAEKVYGDYVSGKEWTVSYDIGETKSQQ